MNVSGKITLFIEDKKVGDDKVIRVYNTNITTKKVDGTYVNKKIPVHFTKNEHPADKLATLDVNHYYTLELQHAWLGVRAYTTVDGRNGREIYLYIKQANWLKGEPIKRAQAVQSVTSNLPF